MASYDKVGIDGVCQKTTGLIVVLNTNAVNISYLLDVKHNLLVFLYILNHFCHYYSRIFNYILYTLLQEQPSLKASTLLERRISKNKKYKRIVFFTPFNIYGCIVFEIAVARSVRVSL